ncbi:MAG: AAA family ATPase [Candidatus Woesearchaeota archaeon]
MDKPIFLITGTAGVGKTTLARALDLRYQLDHRLGTGFIREIVKSQTNQMLDSFLYEFTFRAKKPVAHLIKQARRIYSAIDSCITRAKREGTSLVIEGNHLIPELYHTHNVAGYVILTVSDDKLLAQRLQGGTHTRRVITEQDFQNIKKIDAYFREEAVKYQIPVIEAHSVEDVIIQFNAVRR